MARSVIFGFSLLLVSISSSVSQELTGPFEIDVTTKLRSQQILFQLYGLQVPDRKYECTANGLPWKCGETAQRVLLDYINDKSVECILFPITNPSDTDHRWGECFLRANSLNARMVAEGWALASLDRLAPYQAESNLARTNQVGIFRGGFEPPNEWYSNSRFVLEECGVCAFRHKSFARIREKRASRRQGTNGGN